MVSLLQKVRAGNFPRGPGNNMAHTLSFRVGAADPDKKRSGFQSQNRRFGETRLPERPDLPNAIVISVVKFRRNPYGWRMKGCCLTLALAMGLNAAVHAQPTNSFPL